MILAGHRAAFVEAQWPRDSKSIAGPGKVGAVSSSRSQVTKNEMAGVKLRYDWTVVLSRARSSVWIERLPPEQKVVSSNLTGRTSFNYLAFPTEIFKVSARSVLADEPACGEVTSYIVCGCMGFESVAQSQ